MIDITWQQVVLIFGWFYFLYKFVKLILEQGRI